MGQGANSALLDVLALDSSLDECNDDLKAALPLFSRKQVKEGLALWSLLQLPPKSNIFLGLMYNVAQFLRPFFRRIFKKWPLPTRKALSESLKPFSEIVRENKFWVDVASKGKKAIVPLIN